MDVEQNPLAAEEKGPRALAQQEATKSDCENRGVAAENLEM
jgi:hypothetical protein